MNLLNRVQIGDQNCVRNDGTCVTPFVLWNNQWNILRTDEVKSVTLVVVLKVEDGPPEALLKKTNISGEQTSIDLKHNISYFGSDFTS